MEWQPSLTRSNVTPKAKPKPPVEKPKRTPLKNFNNFKFHMHDDSFRERTQKDDMKAAIAYNLKSNDFYEDKKVKIS
jgi:hypothetical protein